VFARQGYRDATIREICRKAEANVSAVKYHFGDKSRLYLATLEYTIAASQQHYPFMPAESPSLSPEERLRAFVGIFLRRLLDTGRPAWHGRLLLRELTEPTHGFDIIANEIHGNLVERLTRILSAVMPTANDAKVREAAYFVLGQCTFYRHARRYLDKFDPAAVGKPADIDAIGDRIVAFSMAALSATDHQTHRE
jgi:AcrR family transcriptional regulator